MGRVTGIGGVFFKAPLGAPQKPTRTVSSRWDDVDSLKGSNSDPFGIFATVLDPEVHQVELWQPAAKD